MVVSEDTATVEVEQAAEYIRRLQSIHYEPVGYVERIVLSIAHDVHKCAQVAKVVPGVGVEGDHAWKQWWRGRRQEGREVSAINAEVLDAIEVPYDVPGDNLVIRGFDLSALRKNDTIRIGDVILKATGASHRPCATFEKRTSPAKKEAISEGRYRGTLLDALEEGHIRAGDTVERIFIGQLTLPLAAGDNTKE